MGGALEVVRMPLLVEDVADALLEFGVFLVRRRGLRKMRLPCLVNDVLLNLTTDAPHVPP
jgi:hypothetical protein